MSTKKRVLIVDGKGRTQPELDPLLRSEGFETVSARDVGEALDRAARESFDLVLTDVSIAETEAGGLISGLKAVRSDLPIITIADYSAVAAAVRSLGYGADDYITWPPDAEELQKAIQRCLKSNPLIRQNQQLLAELERANADLARHKKLLARRFHRSASELRATRHSLDDYRGQVTAHSLLGEFVAMVHDLDRLLHHVLLIVNRRFHARYSSVMLVEDGQLVLRACEGDRGRQHLGARQPMGAGIAGHVALRDEPVLVRDIHTDVSFRPSPDRKYRTASFLSAPIVYQGNMLGVMNLGDKENDSVFVEDELEMLIAIANQIAPSVENAALYRALEESCAAFIQTLVTVLEAKDRYTSGHSNRVCDYAVALAKAVSMSPSEVEMLRRAAQLHDIGKIAVHDFILKKAGNLTPEERKLFNSHPAIGEGLLQTLDFLKPVRPLIRHHHERLDGRGYPDGLKGRDIPTLVRMLAIADAYDAMTSERPYRPAMQPRKAADEIRRAAGSQFDPELVEAFCDQVVGSNGLR